MKIKPAKKATSTTRLQTKNENVYSLAKKSTKDVSPIDLLEVEIASDPSDSTNEGAIEITIANLSEELIAKGYEEIEIVSEKIKPKFNKKKAKAEDINELLKRKSKPAEEVVVTRIDLKLGIANSKLPKLLDKSRNEEDEDQDSDTELKFVKSTKAIQVKGTGIGGEGFHKSEQDDRQGILEVRLGRKNIAVDGEKTIDSRSQEVGDDIKSLLSSMRDDNLASERVKPNSDRELVEPDSEDPLIKLLKGRIRNKNNKRPPNCVKKSNIVDGIKTETKEPKKPYVKSIKRIPEKKVNATAVKMSLPGPKSQLVIRVKEKKTGRYIRKRLPIKKIRRIPLQRTYPFLKDEYLPKIEAVGTENNRVFVSVHNIDPQIKKLSIYRREISRRTEEDEYEEIASINDPGRVYDFIDIVEGARAFKYVCVADNLPLYTFCIYKDRAFRYSRWIEPKLHAYQTGSNVVIESSIVPANVKKILIYRKSSAEDEEQLVDGISFIGVRRRSLRMIDRPPPIEQTIEYRIEYVDEDGIVESFEDRPKVAYTARLGDEVGNITVFNVKYNHETDEVDINGECYVDNMFMSKTDSVLKNPDENTLKAAARQQMIAKILLRRIDLKTGEDEIILREIISPGLSKFETKVLSLRRINFQFSDSGENAATFGYTPLLPFRAYKYIARIIVYPLGLELRRVTDFTSIPGITAPGRLKYNYDPSVFDHPLNTELGILPAAANHRSFQIADEVGRTSRVITRSVYVRQTDIADSISLESKILIDARYDPVVRLKINIPRGLIDNLDHVQVLMSYDTVKGQDIIDRLFLTRSQTIYFDYSFDDIAANVIAYRIRGIGKNFRSLFTSSPTQIKMDDPIIKKARSRKRALKHSKIMRWKRLQRAREGMDGK